MIDPLDVEIQSVLETFGAQLDTERSRGGIPGFSIVYDQGVLWSKGLGFANLEAGIPAGPQTIYRIGSVTKMFTATLMMLLRDADRLSLDEPIEKHLPVCRLKSRFDEPSALTFRQVASHTAGLPREAPLDIWQQSGEYPPIEVALESLKDAELIFPPFTEIKYSNEAGHAAPGPRPTPVISR
jgi:CubicO group peptidase (beta-lactamase class C family)